MSKVTIIGAGLVGSLEALFMSKRGFEVDLFEKRPDPRIKGYLGGRSINLALSTRGWKALEKVGMDKEIRKIALPMKGRIMHDLEGKLSFQPYGSDGQSIYSVPRGELNMNLLKEADKDPKVNLIFNKKLTNINLKNKELTFKDYSTKDFENHKYNKLIGTDGVFSKVRFELQKTPRFNFSQNYISHGYKELTIPANLDGSHKLDPEALHIWPRGEYMLIALPNQDGTFTCTLFFPYEGEFSFNSITSANAFEDFFKSQFIDAYELIPDVKKDYNDNPTSPLVYVMADPWNYKDSVLLLGDSAHGIVPFYGQGMNSGFEDCTLLDETLDLNNNNWTNTFEQFSKKRVPDAKAISELALYNFIEMRDKVADEDFLKRKKIEKFIHEKHPSLWTPLYSMVTFSNIPYSEALNKGNQQRAIMDEVMKIDDVENIANQPSIETQVLNVIRKHKA